MARFIDADALIKKLTTATDGTRIPDVDCDNFPITYSLRDLKRLIREIPTADVVPKSEVTELETKLRQLDDKLRQYEQVCGKIVIKDGVGIGLLPDGKETVYILKSIAGVTKELAIRRTKQEVAREIFEEIENNLKELKDDYRLLDDMRQTCAVRYAMTRVAELKKKYTEDK